MRKWIIKLLANVFICLVLLPACSMDFFVSLPMDVEEWTPGSRTLSVGSPILVSYQCSSEKILGFDLFATIRGLGPRSEALQYRLGKIYSGDVTYDAQSGMFDCYFTEENGVFRLCFEIIPLEKAVYSFSFQSSCQTGLITYAYTNWGDDGGVLDSHDYELVFTVTD